MFRELIKSWLSELNMQKVFSLLNRCGKSLCVSEYSSENADYIKWNPFQLFPNCTFMGPM